VLRHARNNATWHSAARPLQAEAAGLERELDLARRQIDIERRKQEEMVKERER
jgi:hypothetical protein